MTELLNILIDKNHAQKEALIALLEVLQEEKEVLKKGEPRMLPGLLQKLQEVSGKAMLAEAERNRAAETLSDALGCKPSVRAICSCLDEQGSTRLRKSAGELLSAVLSIKEINYILSRQAEEHRFLSEMTLERMKHFIRPGQAAATLDTRA